MMKYFSSYQLPLSAERAFFLQGRQQSFSSAGETTPHRFDKKQPEGNSVRTMPHAWRSDNVLQ
ncbi:MULTISPECIES: hypothetical protein [unclassified Erwinia]|uniref:hypothetical protein n=1 Tax=unclassified Erwinia TaxID=2622719 RepID=UPI001177BADF|nr:MULTISPECIES: hypothetical protein [unclassified Erwinia]